MTKVLKAGLILSRKFADESHPEFPYKGYTGDLIHCIGEALKLADKWAVPLVRTGTALNPRAFDIDLLIEVDTEFDLTRSMSPAEPIRNKFSNADWAPGKSIRVRIVTPGGVTIESVLNEGPDMV